MSQAKTVGTVKSAGLRFLWEVKNFCSCGENNGHHLLSPVYATMNPLNDHKWLLQLYPKGFTEKNKDFISVYLEYLGQSNVEVTVVLSMLDDKNYQVAEYKFQKLYKKGALVEGAPKFIKQDFVTDKKNRVLVNDTINILCEIIYDPNLAAPLKNKYKYREESLPDYCRINEFDEFGKLLEEENSTSDVTIRIGKDEIKVHKAIIMSRSPVFQAMFEHDMTEKKQSVVDITDITYEVMKEVVRFMYTGKVNKIDGITADLLIAAEKYSIKGLKVLSEKKLFEYLSVINAVEYLKLSDTYNATNLKSEILKFIARNQEDVIHTAEFKLLPMEVECEVLRAIVGIDINK